MAGRYDGRFWDQYKEVQGLLFAISNKHESGVIGCPIEQVKPHANWSLTNNTFEDYYRSRNQHKRGSDIATLYLKEHNYIPTSEIGVEAMVIVVRAYHNGHIAETQTRGYGNCPPMV